MLNVLKPHSKFCMRLFLIIVKNICAIVKLALNFLDLNMRPTDIVVLNRKLLIITFIFKLLNALCIKNVGPSKVSRGS